MNDLGFTLQSTKQGVEWVICQPVSMDSPGGMPNQEDSDCFCE